MSGRHKQYRALFGTDPDFIEADRIRDDSGCVLRYERTFMRPCLSARRNTRSCATGAGRGGRLTGLSCHMIGCY